MPLEERPSDSPFVESVWRSQSVRPGSFISTAGTHWEMVFMKHEGQSILTLRGPETKATPAIIPADGEWLGITFDFGTFMPELPPGKLLDRNDLNLPVETSKSFWLYGSTWEIPDFENADTFVDRLVREGLLVRDPLVEDVMQDCPLDLSPRALQYRFQRATGLSHRAAQQIQRARHAASLLKQGSPILDTAYQLGYFDQSHLTNAIRRYIGQTPTQISNVIQEE